MLHPRSLQSVAADAVHNYVNTSKCRYKVIVYASGQQIILIDSRTRHSVQNSTHCELPVYLRNMDTSAYGEKAN